MIKSLIKRIWEYLFGSKPITPPDNGKKFTNGVRYMIEELKRHGNHEAAHSMAQATEVIYDYGKMDLDVYAIYLNIFRGYKVMHVLSKDNKVFIYFDASVNPLVLQPRTSYNSARDI